MSFIKNIYQFWIETWKTDKVLFFAEAIASILGLFSSSYMAIWSSNPNMWIVLIPWGISAIIMAYVAYKRQSSWLFVLMCFYAINNIVGIINLII